jgi:hypothetical protein
MNYPNDWPRCACGEPVLDGHLTCGDVACNESDARASAARKCREPVTGQDLIDWKHDHDRDERKHE